MKQVQMTLKALLDREGETDLNGFPVVKRVEGKDHSGTTYLRFDAVAKAFNELASDGVSAGVRLSLPDAKKLAEIIKWYRKQIVNHGLPDRKAYRTFCEQKEIELSGNDF